MPKCDIILTMDTTKINFIPAPNYILISPLDKDKKSDMIVVSDPVDKSYKGYIMAIGVPLPNEHGDILPFFANVGDLVLFSIAGVERTKMDYNNDPRSEFIIAPYNRVLGILK